ncbi:hypothetical protein PIB30_040776 [Stylosanthes scabra]|uniref:Uncharacterized protein n=1 Tax=Stylosanthes scabra TaxID=79078 RepID=A0ABU6QEB8_9FABA|nr:hypothetical protein [Stylosanthes scabra]
MVQMPHELPSIYRWVANDMLGASSILNQEYLNELKLFGVLFGGGDLEQRYRIVISRSFQSGIIALSSSKDTANILTLLFSKNKLALKSLLCNLDEGRRCKSPGTTSPLLDFAIFFGRRPPSAGAVSTTSGPSSIASTAGTRATPERGSSCNVGKALDQWVDVSSHIREEEQLPPPTSLKKCPAGDSLIGAKMPRISEGGTREFSMINHSFDASGFIEADETRSDR